MFVHTDKNYESKRNFLNWLTCLLFLVKFAVTDHPKGNRDTCTGKNTPDDHLNNITTWVLRPPDFLDQKMV